ncbi:MAG TPA: glycoside hydrolase family 15 protein [Vicinamibacterales bacterium]|nr:glycoside hydrolase family 15 protein [Vicinamibacterales bacterium]
MASPIEDYALIGDCHTAALVGRDGSIDWWCVPRFDSGACFAALLGGPEHGRWQIVPDEPILSVTRAYRGDTLVLDSTFETASGAITLTDCMPIRTSYPDIVRMVTGVHGTVRMRVEIVIRFDYGSITPWVQRDRDGITATGGPDTLLLRTPVPLRGEGWTTIGEFDVRAGDEVPFVLTWHPSHAPSEQSADPHRAIASTVRWWQDWSAGCAFTGPWRHAVMRSLITLKALTYAPTGGIVAAPTTSLPEHIGGPRNWDYRYCWLRDSTFTLTALMQNGHIEEARAWREWLLRAVAGRGEELSVLYGLAGERRLPELELAWLPGYERSTPVRIGNAASHQFQLDVYGEVLECLHVARHFELDGHADQHDWRVERELLRCLEAVWQEPDEGIWEVRGTRQHFTHSKLMAWVGFDRAVKDVERFGFDGPVERWRALRDQVHEEICTRAFDRTRNTFVQYYGGTEVDAALLMMAMVGFLPPTDPRLAGTVAAVERDLLRDGFVDRYRTHSGVDGLPSGEGTFLLCTCWLADNYALMGRHDDAERIFERVLSVRNDVGLLAEEYDPVAHRQLGNFPQAFSHLGLINTARNLTIGRDRPAGVRQEA